MDNIIVIEIDGHKFWWNQTEYDMYEKWAKEQEKKMINAWYLSFNKYIKNGKSNSNISRS